MNAADRGRYIHLPKPAASGGEAGCVIANDDGHSYAYERFAYWIAHSPLRSAARASRARSAAFGS